MGAKKDSPAQNFDPCVRIGEIMRSHPVFRIFAMNLNDQIQILCQEAPSYGVPLRVMQEAIAPVLIELAQSLNHLSYFVLQTRDRAWQTTTLGRRDDPTQEKTVIYAFARRQDAVYLLANAQNNLELANIPVTHLLFQLFALEPVNSLIFREHSGTRGRDQEIRRQDLQQRVEKKLRNLEVPSPSRSVPANWA
jgi:hypothetical protein